jgi:predicted DNA-binding protein (MmcQ/YjbR family)
VTRGDAFDRPVFARVRRLCLAYPETTEKTAWGHPCFRAGKKMFCTFEMIGGRPSIAFRLPRAEVGRLLRRHSRVVASPYGRGIWISVWVDGPISRKLIESALDRSYRTVATKKLVGLLEEAGGAGKE